MGGHRAHGGPPSPPTRENSGCPYKVYYTECPYKVYHSLQSVLYSVTKEPLPQQGKKDSGY